MPSNLLENLYSVNTTFFYVNIWKYKDKEKCSQNSNCKKLKIYKIHSINKLKRLKQNNISCIRIRKGENREPYWSFFVDIYHRERLVELTL